MARADRSARGNVAIETVAKEIGVSRRHLERLFKDRVGLGVKQITRIHASMRRSTCCSIVRR